MDVSVKKGKLVIRSLAVERATVDNFISIADRIARNVDDPEQLKLATEAKAGAIAIRDLIKKAAPKPKGPTTGDNVTNIDGGAGGPPLPNQQTLPGIDPNAAGANTGVDTSSTSGSAEGTATGDAGSGNATSGPGADGSATPTGGDATAATGDPTDFGAQGPTETTKPKSGGKGNKAK